eukprot:223550_1
MNFFSILCVWVVFAWLKLGIHAEDSEELTNHGLCPTGFRFLAYESPAAVELDSTFGLAYVSFGNLHFYSVSVISTAHLHGTRASFHCDRKYLARVTDVFEHETPAKEAPTGLARLKSAAKKKPQLESMDQHPQLCCVCRVKDAGKARMPLFPPLWFTKGQQSPSPKLKQGRALNWLKYQPDGANGVKYNMLVINKHNADVLCSSQPYFPTDAQASVRKSKAVYFNIHETTQTVPYHPCFPTETTCDTQNQFSFTFFFLTLVTQEDISVTTRHIQAAYSTTGVFDAKALFAHLIGVFDSEKYKGYSIKWLSAGELYKQWNVKLPEDAQIRGSAEWRLVSFCAACPGTSVTVSMSDKKVITQKERIQRAISVGIKLNFAHELSPVSVGLSTKYTKAIYNELAETLATGTAVSIKANCNAFYVYQFDVKVGSKASGFSTIPTRYFYCTDRPYPPKCVPRISGVKEETETAIHSCKGYDLGVDYGADETLDKEFKAPWRSLHSGRPKPLNLVGMVEPGKTPEAWSRPGIKTQVPSNVAVNVHSVRDVTPYVSKRTRLKVAPNTATLSHSAPVTPRNSVTALNLARSSSSLGDMLYFDEQDAKGKSVNDRYEAASRLIQRSRLHKKHRK